MISIAFPSYRNKSSVLNQFLVCVQGLQRVGPTRHSVRRLLKLFDWHPLTGITTTSRVGDPSTDLFLLNRYELLVLLLFYIQQSGTYRMFRIVTLLPIVTKKRMDTKYAVKLPNLNCPQFPKQIWSNLFFQEKTRSRMLKYYLYVSIFELRIDYLLWSPMLQ